jgi:hypothetical protein
MKVFFLCVTLIVTSCTSKPSQYITSKKAIRQYLLKTLDDPDSYRPVDYTFDTSRKYSSGWRVEHTFRSKNKFGAVVLNGYYFDLDSNFEVVNIEDLEQGYHFQEILPDAKPKH